MKSFVFFLPLFLFVTCTGNAQQFQPEDVVQTIGLTQLKFKHVMAYVDMEIAGEDPALLNNQAFMQRLTIECLEEYADDPVGFVADLDQYYLAMQTGAGFVSQGNQTTNQYTTPKYTGNTQYSSPTTTPATGNSQWKQLLSGSALFYTVTQSTTGMAIQTTQIMHLCSNGNGHIYQNSGGGGGAITALQHMEYQGSFNWDVIEQGGQAYFSFSMQGASQALPMRIINQKIQIQGLGNFSVQQGGAKCF